MPTKITDFVMKRAVDGFIRALKKIDQASGYNTTPKVQLGHRPLNKVPAGEFPHLAVEMGDLSPVSEQYGGSSLGNIRWGWPAFVWGYVSTSGHRSDLYDAGLALLVDVFAAVYVDECLTDGDGQKTIYLIDPGEIVFDMEQFSTEGKGYFLATFEMRLDIIRGEEP